MMKAVPRKEKKNSSREGKRRKEKERGSKSGGLQRNQQKKTDRRYKLTASITVWS